MTSPQPIMEIANFKEDLFDLKDFALRLEKFISVEHQFVRGGLVIALSSKYGSGKSTFLKMWKESIESRHEKDNPPLVIPLNAWESDYFGDPLFAIVSSLVECVKKTDQSPKPILDAVKGVAWYGIALGGQVVKKATGADPLAAAEYSEKREAARNGREKTDTFSIYEGRKAAMNKLQSEIRSFVTESKRQVVFMVDEMDRCRPDYAISYLETIKHIFDVQGAVFILAADRKQLQNSARTAFGPDLDFDEYYRKFVHREVTLPRITENGYRLLTRSYISNYIERDGSRNTRIDMGRHGYEHIVQLITALKLTPRQIQEVFRILGHLCESQDETGNKLYWCVTAGAIAMSALKVANSIVFDQLGSKSMDPKEALQFLRGLLDERESTWYFILFLTGDGLKGGVDDNGPRVAAMTHVGLQGDEKRVAEFHQGWGWHSHDRLTNIREKIDHVDHWG